MKKDPIILKINPLAEFSGINGLGNDRLAYLNVDFDNDNNKENENNNYINGENKNKEYNNEEEKEIIKGEKENKNKEEQIENENNKKQKNKEEKENYNVILGGKEELFSLSKRVLLEPGGLVSIPTETVYGLGGNIYLEESLRRIFEIKKRPLNDPLIVHVYSFDYALEHLYDVNEMEAELIKYLAEKYTPGPLTIVSRCKKTVPAILTNGTGYLGVRCPKNPVCLELLKYIKVPLAAPSANKFGHISPTCPEHVFNEFRGERVYILDGGPCEIGIESTVIKVYTENKKENKEQEQEQENKNKEEEKEYKNKTEEREEQEIKEKRNKEKICLVEILRKGAVVYEDLREKLKRFKNVKVYESVKRADGNNKIESPGMLTTHYAPDVPTYMVKEDDKENKNKINGENKENKINENENKENKEINEDCRNIIFIDIGCRYKKYSKLFKTYFSVENDPMIIANQLYSLLRRAEDLCLNKSRYKEDNNKENENKNKNNINGEKIKEKEITNNKGEKNKNIIVIYFNEENVDLYSSIYDRLMRATSGNVVYLKEEGGIHIVRE